MCPKGICAFLGFLVIYANRIGVCAYTNQWAAHIEGGPEVAQEVARDHGFRYLDKIVDDWYHMEHRSIVKRSTEPHHEIHQRLVGDSRVRRAEQQRAKSRTKRDLIIKRGHSGPRIILNDERWPQMWYLNRGNGLDMNVQGAWTEGITGSGVVVTILDDGLEKDHPDLTRNYDPQASYDVNSHDEDPMPRYDEADSNRHGTRCAGEVAATANNSNCAVGVAFGAGVGGVRMLDGDVTDAVEARSLSLNPQHIDIYSASWGPDDDGKTVDGPGELATRAFVEGITKGRKGKGSIFVWASGNGGRDHDNCNCDGYTNSIWTLSISSATENGLVPWYSEACSSTLATTYSSGSTGEKQVVTTDLHQRCTSSHTGTSASAPLAAGICALALEANRDLTWRDMQHIVVRTARPANLKATDWVVNGVGRNVSHSFGYGLMDASAMVRLARRWRTVPEQHKCEVSAPHTDRQIPPKSQLVLELHVKECSGVNFLEHVQAKVSLMAFRRGDLQIQLTSPQGTKSTLLAKRPHDISKAGFMQWPFMSVHTWGERPHGTWKLEIHNEGRYLGRATLHEWALIFHGTSTLPDRTEYALYNPAVINVPRRPFLKPRETTYTRSQNALGPTKSRQNFGTAQSQRKNKSRGPHKNKSANRATPKPTIQTLRGLTAARGPNAGDVRYVTSRPKIRTTLGPLPSSSRTTIKPNPTVSSQQRGIILMEPVKTATDNVPAIFQHYDKIQQLYPLYPVYGAGVRGAGQQYSTRAKGPDLLQDEQFGTKSHHLDKDTLKEWKMVLYGTDTSLEIGDDLDKGKVGIIRDEVQDNAAVDARQNVVDTEGDPWTGSQQVDRVSHPEVQRPTTENQTSGGGCAVYDGRQCLECNSGWYIYQGNCSRRCPVGSYATFTETNTECASCHYSCASCIGPANDQCTSCHEDASFLSETSTVSQCVLTTIARRVRTTSWYYWMCILLVVNLVIFTSVVMYRCVLVIQKRRQVSKFYSYTKVAFSPSDDTTKDSDSVKTELMNYESE
ncbi:furin-like protease 1 isoform X2 [Cephus cinctus]|uniref:furin n=1 Tax=Cephus cinctus TaxID=211228 RepID=A0AAJ7RGN0_CEPCN|nr:furin-like protease 1 isoform X2 [Cephus cinctus]